MVDATSDRRDADPVRKIFFPLRSAVELFSDPRSPDVVTKAKEAAVLYDELIFEVGLLDVSITSNGSTSFWNPPESMTPDLLERTRQINAVGSPMILAFGTEREPGAPAQKMEVVFEGQVSNAYLAEFHTGIMDELAPFEPDWVRTVDIGMKMRPGWMGDPIYDAIGRMNFSDFRDPELIPEVDPFLRSFIYESFNRDAIVATALGASFTATPLFRPMIARGGIEAEAAGAEALAVVVGDMGALPWEAVFAYRDHAGSREARERLREFERLASEAEPRDAYDYIRRVGHEVNRAFAAAIEDLAPSLPEEMAKQLLLNGVALVSVIGAPVAAFAGIASDLSASRASKRSWISAVMSLAQARSR
ncbi:MAG: hypothetical protein JST08_00345 [Actinobacteria bacterium]|nr:hypothetical protein [Actinomycetota bacterium]